MSGTVTSGATRPASASGRVAAPPSDPPSRAATYRDVFAVREYRSLFAAQVLSIVGDQLTAVAASYLVYATTGSAALAATAFATSLLAWVVGAPLLSGLADRLPRRRVLVSCDVARAGLVTVLAVTTLPIGPLIVLLFAANLLSPPFRSARAALMPEVLDGDRYPVANGLDNLVRQVGQLAGFAAGGVLVAAISPRGALLVDAATFAVSALLISTGVRRRPAAQPGGAGGVRAFAAAVTVVFADRRLRAYVLMFWLPCAFTYALEGLALPLATQYGSGPEVAGLLLAAAPAGVAIGGIVLTRLCPPPTRLRLVVPMAMVSCAVLVTVWLPMPLWLMLGVFAVAGFGNAYTIPLNALFGAAVPNSYRGRAFGAAVAGAVGLQGLAQVLAGVATDAFGPAPVIAVSGVLGTLSVVALTPLWRSGVRTHTPATADRRPSS